MILTKSFDFIPEYAQNYLYYCKNIRNMSEKTVNEYYLDLRIFFRFIKSYKILDKELPFNEIDASDVGPEILAKLTLSDIYIYINYTHDERMDDVATRSRKISSLKSFFKYLCKQGFLSENPTLYLDAPKMKNSLPVYLTVEESFALLDSIDGNNKVRNFAIITLFLNCGLRLSELVGINLNNINQNTLRVIGKGNKERNLYLNDACKNAIDDYLKLRPHDGIPNIDKNALFISRNKKRISNRMVQNIVETYLNKAGLDTDKYSTHKLRHTAATLMHQNGVDIRILQEILGHASLGTTQIYTHLENKQIKNALESNPLNRKKDDKNND